jgi:UPF0042 nucleotide-binding protein
VVTGMAGAGKSHAIRALEDLGYYCVDNLPTALIPVLADLSRHEHADKPKVAVVVDVREGVFIREFPPIWRRLLTTTDLDPVLVFLEANDAALFRRFSETRRPHPLAPDRPVSEAINEERRMLAKIRAMADVIVDTSDLTVHELRQTSGDGARPPRGAAHADVQASATNTASTRRRSHFDCRFLPNHIRRQPARAGGKAVATYPPSPRDTRLHAPAAPAS